MINDIERQYIEKSSNYLNNCIEELENIIHKIQSMDDKDLKYANITIIIFLYEIFISLDGIHVLIQEARFRSTIILIRNLLDITFQVLYLCNDRSELKKKVDCYYLFTIYKNRMILENKKNHEGLNPKEENDYKKYCEYDTILKDTYLKQKQSEINKIVQKGQYLDSWYHIYDRQLSSFRKLVMEVGSGEIFNRIYGKFSQIAHGGDAYSNLKVQENGLSLKKVNDIKKGYLLLNVVGSLLDEIIKKLDALYSNPGEHIIFNIINKSFTDEQKQLYQDLVELDKQLK
jgi:hypothetical protein